MVNTETTDIRTRTDLAPLVPEAVHLVGIATVQEGRRRVAAHRLHAEARRHAVALLQPIHIHLEEAAGLRGPGAGPRLSGDDHAVRVETTTGGQGRVRRLVATSRLVGMITETTAHDRLDGKGTTRILARRDRAKGPLRLEHGRSRQPEAGECVRRRAKTATRSRALGSIGMQSCWIVAWTSLTRTALDAPLLLPETTATIDAAHPRLGANVPIHTQQTHGAAVGRPRPDLRTPPTKLLACSLLQPHEDPLPALLCTLVELLS